MGTEEKTVKNITDDDNYSVPVSEEESTLSDEVDEVAEPLAVVMGQIAGG